MEIPIVTRYIDEDEWWPVFSLTEGNWGKEVHVPITLVERYDAAYKEFRAVQDILRKFYES